MSFDAKQLLEKAKANERLAAHELDQVASNLADPKSSHDKYTLIHIIGLSEERRHQGLIEQFLGDSGDPLLSRIALITLCQWWGLTEEYLAQVVEIARGIPWDVDQEVRQVAVSTLGEYLRTHDDKGLLQLLIDIADDPAEWDLMREDSVRAIARALGLGYDSLPPASRREPVDSAWSTSILMRAKDLLSN